MNVDLINNLKKVENLTLLTKATHPVSVIHKKISCHKHVVVATNKLRRLQPAISVTTCGTVDRWRRVDNETTRIGYFYVMCKMCTYMAGQTNFIHNNIIM